MASDNCRFINKVNQIRVASAAGVGGRLVRGAQVRHNKALMIKKLYALLSLLARPTLFFYALPWLMVLLVAGTLAQRDLGLYQAEKIYFSSLFFWIGPLPAPGALLILTAIAVNLAAKLCLKSPWRPGGLGTLVIHSSMLVLLVGGLLSVTGREEGYLELAVGAQGSAISDYHDRELAVFRDGTLAFVLTEAQLQSASTPVPSGTPFQIQVQHYCRNCATLLRPAVSNTETVPLRGDAAKIQLKTAPLLAQDEDNRAGVEFTVTGLGQAIDGLYVADDELLHSPAFTYAGVHYSFITRHAQRVLPFSLKLRDFQKINHPGTDLARAYVATVEVIDGEAVWPVVISMNAPLRYRGYTFYQASFIDREGALATVLTVVKNNGQIYPYIAIAMLCVGMLLHLMTKLLPRHRVLQAAS